MSLIEFNPIYGPRHREPAGPAEPPEASSDSADVAARPEQPFSFEQAVDQAVRTMTGEAATARSGDDTGDATAESSRHRRVGNLGRALTGAYGPRPQLIADTVLDLLELLLAKDADYGASTSKQPILAPDVHSEAAIRVRISDKLNRLIQLQTQAAMVKDETFEDTLRDVAGYFVLWLVEREQARQQTHPAT